MRQLDENLWVAEMPHRFFSVPIGARMTIVRFPSGEIWLHSPIRLTNSLKRRLDELGPVRFIVSPNSFHFMHLQEYSPAYPEARFYMTERVAARKWRLPDRETLRDEPPESWQGNLEQTLFRGSFLLDEVVFLHPPSRTLILTDVCAHLERDPFWWTRLLAKMGGVYDKLAPPPLERLSMNDKKAVRASLERVLQWDFERIIVAHGRITESGGKDALRRAFDWL